MHVLSATKSCSLISESLVNANTFVIFHALHMAPLFLHFCRGWFVHGSNGAWNVVFCNVTALEVTYTYSSSRYIVDKSVPTSTLSAQHVMTVGFMDPTFAVSYAVDGAGLQENTTFEEAYSLELSRQTLARGAYMYEAIPVLGINNELIVIGTRLQIIPLMLFVLATLIFS